MGKHKSAKPKGNGCRKKMTVMSLQLIQRITGLGISGSDQIELDDLLAQLRSKYVNGECDRWSPGSLLPFPVSPCRSQTLPDLRGYAWSRIYSTVSFQAAIA